MNIPLSHVKANCIAFPPAPQNASIMVSHLHLSAICSAIFSGVTENQLSINKYFSNKSKANHCPSVTPLESVFFP